MRRFRPHTWYRSDLKPIARQLRRDSTPAERKLWYEFLLSHREKFTRQKPLGHYIADLCEQAPGDQGRRYDARRTAALAIDGVRIIRFTNADVMTNFETVCARIEEALKI